METKIVKNSPSPQQTETIEATNLAPNEAQADECIVSESTLTDFVLGCITYFSEKPELWQNIIKFVDNKEKDSIKISKKDEFSLPGMFRCTTSDKIKDLNKDKRRWFEQPFYIDDKTVFLSTQWCSGPKKGIRYPLMMSDFQKFVPICFGEEFQCINKNGNNWELWRIVSSNMSRDVDKSPLQQIFYGAPGTGKSNDIKQLTGEGKDGIFSKDFTFRTTFHPDSDYSSFVGAYKPVWDETLKKIVYAFRPQTFLKAYIAAWKNPEQNVALVIEEINRGNCAQVFGDIFQLLDREKNGLSKYPIEADLDMKGFLCNALNSNVNDDDLKEEVNAYYGNHYNEAFDKITNGDILALPKNLSILATMNTSDQSLFPMDSAFKRRWEWKYKPIANENKNWKIKLSDDYELIDWWKFLSRINNVISDLTTSEDKQLGYFFCMPDEKNNEQEEEPTIISAKTFVGKVIFYLWNDVFKDYAFDASCCKDENDKEVLFAKFYNEDGEDINMDVLVHFFDSLKAENGESLVKKLEKQAPVQEDASGIGSENTTETPVETIDNESEGITPSTDIE